MNYQRLESPQEFYDQAGGYLLRHEAANNLLLGLTGNLIKRPNFYNNEPPYFGIVRSDDGEIIATALRTPPRAVILSHVEDREALRLIAEDVHTVYSKIPAVTGQKHDSRGFAEMWTLLSGQQAAPGMFQRIYSVEKIVPVPGVAGSARRADAADSERLHQWMRGFQQAAFPSQEPISDESLKTLIENRLSPELGGMYFWEDAAGQPVSMAGYTGFTENGVRIGPVYTPAEYRGHGYGSAVTAAVSQMLLDSGRRFCYLFTDLNNPTSNRIYQHIGYEAVCDIDEYVFDHEHQH